MYRVTMVKNGDRVDIKKGLTQQEAQAQRTISRRQHLDGVRDGSILIGIYDENDKEFSTEKKVVGTTSGPSPKKKKQNEEGKKD